MTQEKKPVVNIQIINTPEAAREYTLGVFRERIAEIDKVLADPSIDFLNTFVLETAKGVFYGGRIGYMTAVGIERAKRLTQDEATWLFAQGITDGAGVPARVRDFGSALRESRATMFETITSIKRRFPKKEA